MNRTRSIRPALGALVVLIAVVMTGCGSDNSSIVRPPIASPTTQSPTPTPTATPSAGPRHPVTTVRPATGLRAGQTVTVTASGFSPGLSLIVVECADKGKQTGAGDCNLTGSATVQTDAGGRTSTQLRVTPGPFGGNNVICSAKLHCLISVTEASLSPTQEADAPISFR